MWGLFLDGYLPPILSVPISGTLAFSCKRSSTRLERTSPSAGGCRYPCMGTESIGGRLCVEEGKEECFCLVERKRVEL